jgi:hypothetical protein
MKTLNPTWEARPASLRFALAAATSAQRVREPALNLLDRLQVYPADLQIETVAAALVILAFAINKDPHDLISRAKRQATDIEAFEHDVLAIADYAKGELQ